MVSPCDAPNNDELPDLLGDPQAERSVISSLLHGATGQDIHLEYFTDDQRRQLVGMILKLQNAGRWKFNSDRTGDVTQLVESNKVQLIEICEQTGWLNDPLHEIEACSSVLAGAGKLEEQLAYVQQSYKQREAIRILQERLAAVQSGDLDPALAGIDFEFGNSDKNGIKTISSYDFANTEFTTQFHIPGVLTVGEPCVIGGASKSLKTSIAIDLAISLAAGKPFLGEYRVTKPAKVGVISAESGRATIQDTAKRICACKHLNLAELPIEWGFDVPLLTDPVQLKSIEKLIQEKSIEVLILDPVYLMLMDQHQAGNASNVFSMGSVLRHLSDLIGATGTTLVIVHHTTKSAARTGRLNGEPPDLEDLSMAGFAEFARQWLLLGRRSRYVEGSGLHELWLRYGGSAGHSGLTGLDVREGRISEVGGRHWAVTVRDPVECRDEKTSAADSRKVEQATIRVRQQLEDDMKRVREVAHKFQDGETQTKIAEAAQLSNRRCGAVLNALEDDGEWQRFDVQKSNRKKPYPGWRPVPSDLRDNRTSTGLSDSSDSHNHHSDNSPL